jgi:hypothetical protein
VDRIVEVKNAADTLSTAAWEIVDRHFVNQNQIVKSLPNWEVHNLFPSLELMHGGVAEVAVFVYSCKMPAVA